MLPVTVSMQERLPSIVPNANGNSRIGLSKSDEKLKGPRDQPGDIISLQ